MKKVKKELKDLSEDSKHLVYDLVHIIEDIKFYQRQLNNKITASKNPLLFSIEKTSELRKDPEWKKALKSWENDLFLIDSKHIGEELRLIYENAVYRIDSFIDKTLLLINKLAFFNLNERDIKLDILIRSRRINHFPTLKKVLKTLSSTQDLYLIRRARNKYLHRNCLLIYFVALKNGDDIKIESLVYEDYFDFYYLKVFDKKTKMTLGNLLNNINDAIMIVDSISQQLADYILNKFDAKNRTEEDPQGLQVILEEMKLKNSPPKNVK